jgi:hypothetical protein
MGAKLGRAVLAQVEGHPRQFDMAVRRLRELAGEAEAANADG